MKAPTLSLMAIMTLCKAQVAHYLLAGTIEPFMAYGVGCFLFAPAPKLVSSITCTVQLEL